MKNSQVRKSNRWLRSSTSSGISEDLISDLPDSVIQHILSFLDTKDAVKTCVLSKRWESLWTTIPNLSFHCKSLLVEVVERFTSFVDKTLMKHNSLKIKKFSLDFYRDYAPDYQVNSWLQFAVNHEVEEFCLQIPPIYGASLYNWPDFMRTNSSVTKMCLTFGITGLGGFYWRSLKFLSIRNSFLRKDTIRSFLEGSPLLECLTLQECILDNELDIISFTSLKELVLDRHHADIEDRQIDISGPNLLLLTIAGWIYGPKFNLVNVSSLVEANIDITMGYREKTSLKDLIQELRHVNKLKVGIWCYQAPYIRKFFLASFPTVTRNILEIDMKSANLSKFSAVLRNSPDLEQLTINLRPLYDEFDSMEDSNEGMDLEPVIEPLPNRHLKIIQITGLETRSCSRLEKLLVEMVQYLLANAKVLQKLIIHVEANSLTSAKPKLLRKWLEITSYPRASTDAVVLFESQLQ